MVSFESGAILAQLSDLSRIRRLGDTLPANLHIATVRTRVVPRECVLHHRQHKESDLPGTSGTPTLTEDGKRKNSALYLKDYFNK
jgi:hypothetical protein